MGGRSFLRVFSIFAAALRVRGVCALAAIVALAVVACTPESLHTLPDKARIAPDARLIGRWQARVDGVDYVAEVTRADPLTLRVALTETLPVGQRPVTKTAYGANVYAVGPRTILAARELEPTPGNWRFAAVLLTGDDRVTLMFMDDKVVYPEVNRAAFPGTIRTFDPTFPDIVMTANPADLEAFIRNNDTTRLFAVPFGPFERLP